VEVCKLLQRLEQACCGVHGNATCCSPVAHNETGTCYCPPCLPMIGSRVYDSVVTMSVLCVLTSFAEVRIDALLLGE